MTAKILVADDEQNITKLLRLYLRQEGYEVVVARDGREALDRFAVERPDLALLDLMMPKLGVDAPRSISVLREELLAEVAGENREAAAYSTSSADHLRRLRRPTP